MYNSLGTRVQRRLTNKRNDLLLSQFMIEMIKEKGVATPIAPLQLVDIESQCHDGVSECQTSWYVDINSFGYLYESPPPLSHVLTVFAYTGHD